MPYPEDLVLPMREELTRHGFEELRAADAADRFFADASRGTSLLVINSTCGCSAGNARPAVARAVATGCAPDRRATVFAGQDLEATARVREYLVGIPPSSPFIAVLEEGEPVLVLERHHIKGRPVDAITADLVQAFRHLAGEDVEMPRSGASGPGPDWQVPPAFRSIL